MCPAFGRLLWCILLLGLAAQPPAGVRAGPASAIIIDSMSVSHTFGGQMIFTLSAHSDADITSAALFIRDGQANHTGVVELAVTPSRRLEAQFIRDLQAEPILPFAPVVYAWRLTDASGQALTTPEFTHIYDDNRFTWQTLRRGAIRAHWYGGDLAFGQGIADIAFEALHRVSRFIDAPPPERVNVYVYASLDDLRSGLRLGGRTWIGGHADPALGVVLVAAAPDQQGLIGLQRDLPHELAHVMVYQATGPGYGRMPVWLDEGLAVNSELQPNPDYAVALAESARAEALLPLEALCGAFGVDPGQALLSYAESASVVRYILDRWGTARMAELLAAYRDGATCEGGVQRVLQVSLAELQAGWQRDVLEASPLTILARQVLPVLVVFIPVAIVIAGLVFWPKRK